jgi:SEC-C motif.
MVLPQLESVPEEEYREVRRNLLYEYCLVTKLSFPDAADIVGITTESGRGSYGSEDLVYYDARVWTPEEQVQTEQLQKEMRELGLIGDHKMSRGTEKEYPDVQSDKDQGQHAQPSVTMKGRNWNDICPCGSGKKLKKCHGK